MGREKRVAAEKSRASVQQLQQLQLQFSSTGELKAGPAPLAFRRTECAGDWDDYGHGSILRIRVANFQKYEECVIHPGPHMNMIMGPNGSGKSTLVGAIALGLGFGTAVLGRSRDIGEFIKYGAQQAMIELVLKVGAAEAEAEGVDADVDADADADANANDNPTQHASSHSDGTFVVVKRVLHRDASTETVQLRSEWLINDQPTTHRAVQKLAADLNLQVDNLCQFLPQDKVSEFARMNPMEMLVATERAAAAPVIHEQHQQLVQLREQDRTLSTTLAREQKALEQDQRQVDVLQGQMQRAQEREESQQRIQLMLRKRPWLEYQSARQHFQHLKTVRDEARRQFETATQLDGPLRQQLNAVEDRLRVSAKRRHTFARQLRVRRAAIHESGETLRHLGATADAKRREILRMRAALERCREEIERERGELRRKEELVRAGPPPAISPEADDELRQRTGELRVLENQAGELDAREEALKRDGDTLRGEITRAQTRLGELENVRLQRIDSLRRVNPPALHAYEWLCENRSLFSAPVYGPLGLEFGVRDARQARVVESCISKSVLVSFVCTNAGDQELLLRRTTDERGWVINCILLDVGAIGPDSHPPLLKREELARLGFDALVLDLLEGPEAILSALCELSRVHSIPVCFGGSDKIDIAACERTRNLVKFVSSENFFEVKRSRYDPADVATRCAPLKGGFMLSVVEGEDRRDRYTTIIEDGRRTLRRNEERMRATLTERDQLRVQRQRLEHRLAELNGPRREHIRALAQHSTNQLHVERSREKLRDLTASLSSDFDESALRVALKRMFAERADGALRHTELVLQLHQLLARSLADGMQDMCDGAERDRLHRERDRREFQAVGLRQQLRDAERAMDAAKEMARAALERAQTDEPTAELRAAFEQLPDSLAQLDSAIQTEEAQLAARGRGDLFGAHSLEEYRSRQESVQRLQESVARLTAERTTVVSDMEQLRDAWLPAVNAMVSRVADDFSRLFARLGCRGTVALEWAEGASAVDFDRYELAIRVAFRDGEPLQRLTAQRQSGGEKSVSTILYLLSLQELSRAPFRVVDEINQGMDASNERRVHELIVETAVGAGGVDERVRGATTHGTQYFLITPKLLTGLVYHPRMHVLCVYNGPGVPSHQRQ